MFSDFFWHSNTPYLETSTFHTVSSQLTIISKTHPYCHGPCSVTFFPKNNQRTAPTESPMMAASPLFSATITTGHLRRTYIEAPLEYSLHSATTKTTCILIIVITNQHHVLSTAAQPQPHHAPHTFHVPGQSHRARTSLEVMSHGHHKDLRGFMSASFGCYDFEQFRLYSHDCNSRFCIWVLKG